jgi:hypothetical protein
VDESGISDRDAKRETPSGKEKPSKLGGVPFLNPHYYRIFFKESAGRERAVC